MAFWGIFSPKSPQGTRNTSQKRVNDKVSNIGTCKFEFTTIKNHYNDIHNGILDKQQKKPQKGVFLALKEPPGHTQSYPGVQIKKIM